MQLLQAKPSLMYCNLIEFVSVGMIYMGYCLNHRSIDRNEALFHLEGQKQYLAIKTQKYLRV